MAARYPIRIFADRHVSDVQEPPDTEVLRPSLEVVGEVADGLARSGGTRVDRLGAQREDAARSDAAGDAVLRLAATECSDPAERLDISPQQFRAVRIDGLGLLEGAIGLGEFADRHVQESQEDAGLHRLRSTGRGPTIDGGKFRLGPIDPSLTSPLVGRPDLFERPRIHDRSRKPEGQSLAAVVRPIVGIQRYLGPGRSGLRRLKPGLVGRPQHRPARHDRAWARRSGRGGQVPHRARPMRRRSPTRRAGGGTPA